VQSTITIIMNYNATQPENNANSNNPAVIPMSSATLMVLFEGEASRTTSETNHLTVQTNEPITKVQSQIVVTPSPANNNNNNNASTQFTHLYDPSHDFAPPSVFLSPTLSYLQKTVETQLHITTTSTSSTASSTGKVTTSSLLSPSGPISGSGGGGSSISHLSPQVNDESSSTFGSTIPEAPNSTQQHVLRDHNISIVERTMHQSDDTSPPPSLNQFARRRKLDTIYSNKSPRHHPIYTADRYIIPNRVQKHTQQSIYASSSTTRSGYSPKLRSSPSSSSYSNLQPPMDLTAPERISSENQENVNPNLPLL
jgi:hypothetical protein